MREIEVILSQCSGSSAVYNPERGDSRPHNDNFRISGAGRALNTLSAFEVSDFREVSRTDSPSFADEYEQVFLELGKSKASKTAEHGFSKGQRFILLSMLASVVSKVLLTWLPA